MGVAGEVVFAVSLLLVSVATAVTEENDLNALDRTQFEAAFQGLCNFFVYLFWNGFFFFQNE